MELDGPPRMAVWITWSGRERSSQTQYCQCRGSGSSTLPSWNQAKKSDFLAIQPFTRPNSAWACLIASFNMTSLTISPE